MADIYGSWVTNGSGSSQRSWRAWMNYSISSSNTQTTFTASCRLDLDGGSGTTAKYFSNAISAKLYVDGAVVKTFTNPSAVTVHGDTNWTMTSHSVTWNKTTSAKSHSAYWTITSAKGSWGGTSTTGSVSISVPALASYTVSYNANGGSGSVASQTKYYNQTLTLRNNSFSRAGYAFSGWNTNSAGTGTNYAAGGSYTGNAALTLYAKWTPYKVTIRYNTNGGTVETNTTQTTRWRAVNGVLQISTNSGASWTNATSEVTTAMAHCDMWNVGTPPIRKIGHYVVGTAAWNTKADGTGVNLNQDDYSGNTVNCVTTVRLNGGSHLTGNKTVDVYPKWIRRYTVYVKVNGAWQLVEPKIKINGTWKEADAIYVKDGGAWKE